MDNYYAGIGSRSTPEDVLQEMREIAQALARLQWTLRSGGADGADAAFEYGCKHVNGMKEIFRAGGAMPWAYEEAEKHIPADRPPFRTWKPYTRALIARNMMQVLGEHGDKPVRFVLCWTLADVRGGGGTGYAMRCAAAHDIEVINLQGMLDTDPVSFARQLHNEFGED